MDRREFLSTAAVGLVAAPRWAAAQPQTRVARVGCLYFSSRQIYVDTGRHQAFLEGMRELGYVEGRNLVVEVRFADGKSERLSTLAGELVGLKVDVIVGSGGPALRTLHHATRTIPVVAPTASDPVGDGYAATLARPGGNFTGISLMAYEMGPKELELLKVAVPRLSRVGFLSQPTNPGHPPLFVRITSAAQKIGIQAVLAQAGTVEEIGREFARLAKDRVHGVIIGSDQFFLQEARTIADQAIKHRLPSVCLNRDLVRRGILMSYGPNVTESFRRAATYVDKILKGAKPGDLPFEQPTRYSLMINAKTAKALGLTIPPALLQQAEEVIQ